MPGHPARPIARKLLIAFVAHVALVLVALWLASLVFLLHKERDAQRDALRTHASVLATHTTAALMFADTALLNEDLASLRYLPDVDWALVVASSITEPAADRRVLARYREPPDEIAALLDGFDEADDTRLLDDLLVTYRAIEHGGIVLGHLLIAIDMSRHERAFFVVVLSSLGVGLLVLALFVLTLRRVIAGLTDPLAELAALAGRIGDDGKPTERARVGDDDEIGRLAGAFNRMLDTLNARQAALATSRDDLRILSQRLLDIREEERTRIAHEIHDELGQRLTALKYSVCRLPEDAARTDLAGQIDVAVAEVRAISWGLRPGLLDSIGLHAALEWLCNDFQRRVGIRCGVTLPASESIMDPAQATDLFRICQELLTNVARHARATRADVAIAMRGALLELDVSDDGVGMPEQLPAQRSLGLLGLRERVARWHGRFEIDGRPLFPGTRVRITLPVAPLPPPPPPPQDSPP